MQSSLDVQEWLQANLMQTFDDDDIADHPKPVRLGCGWTKTGEEAAQYSHGDFSGLAALQLPPVPLDLNNGIENFVPKREGVNGSKSPGIELLIKEAFVAQAPLSNCDILTYRNNMNKILGTPFDLKYPWTVDATSIMVGSSKENETETRTPTLFLDIVHDDELSNLRSGDPTIPFIAWGYNFEAKCTGAPYADANSEYGMLVNFKLEKKNSDRAAESSKLSIYLGAEIDSYDPAELPPEHDVQSIPPMSSLREIKTFTMPQHPGQWRTTYNFRHPKWWLQSFLAGVPGLVLGQRDNKGIVHHIDVIPTADLPRISRKNGCRWSPNRALAFGADVLSWMAEFCRSDECVTKHVRFVYSPERRMIAAWVLEDGDLPDRVTAAILQQEQEQVE